MLRFTLVLLLILHTATAKADFEKVKRTFETAKCLLNNTKTICIIGGLLARLPMEPVEQRVKILGLSKKYFLVAAGDNWLKLTVNPGESRKEDLLLIDKSGESMIVVDWHEGEKGDFKKIARKPLEDMLGLMKSEPDQIEADFPPYKDNGIIYNICYTTVKKTTECMISAAVNLNGGMVTLYGITAANEEGIADGVVQVIASVDPSKS